ncbi:MAG: hypothetical protein EOO54_11770 [Haliea sp.]|nr:MAG: hypothetical protein EOO54_11770 [Haliea sp.]
MQQTRTPRQQQQQPQRHIDRQQQQMSGSGEFQPARRTQAGDGRSVPATQADARHRGHAARVGH